MAQFDVTRDLLLERLTWDWQPLEPIVKDLIPTVAPGVAKRTYDSKAETARRNGRRKDLGNRGAQTVDEQIASGARHIVMSRLRALQNSGRVIVDEVDGTRCVKFFDRRQAAREGCPHCSENPTQAPPKRPQLTERRTRGRVLYPVIPAWQKVAEEHLHVAES